MIIPPRWWHQVIHLEPSVAVASQHMSSHSAHRVLQHIRDWCGCADTPLPQGFEQLPIQQRIEQVLRAGLRAQHGRSKGEKLYSQLMRGGTE